MRKDPNEIAQQIVKLVTELSELAGGKLSDFVPNKSALRPGSKRKTSGATGGLRLLVEDGFFDEAKQIAEVRNRMKQEGRLYGDSTIAMGLLGLVRKRILTRLKQKGDKSWKYTVRR